MTLFNTSRIAAVAAIAAILPAAVAAQADEELVEDGSGDAFILEDGSPAVFLGTEEQAVAAMIEAGCLVEAQPESLDAYENENLRDIIAEGGNESVYLVNTAICPWVE
jgi:hypothetical protein